MGSFKQGRRMNVTKFIGKTNPFTNEPLIKLVPIPERCTRALKGKTKYDTEFMGLMDCKQALQIPEDEFQPIRKALYRFMINQGIRQSHAVRQFKNHKTKTFSLWLVNEPPRAKEQA
jgi:hypothetical protein